MNGKIACFKRLLSGFELLYNNSDDDFLVAHWILCSCSYWVRGRGVDSPARLTFFITPKNSISSLTNASRPLMAYFISL